MSAEIRYVDPKQLRPHKLNQWLYGEPEVSDDFVDSIRNGGVREPDSRHASADDYQRSSPGRRSARGLEQAASARSLPTCGCGINCLTFGMVKHGAAKSTRT
jgi:hypothetical protein